EIRRRLLRPVHHHLGGQATVEGVGPALYRDPALGAKADHLAQRMHARVGAAGPQHPHLFPRQGRDGLLQEPLNGGPPPLALKAQHPRAVVGDHAADVSHRNRHPTHAKNSSDPARATVSPSAQRGARHSVRPTPARHPRASMAKAKSSARRKVPTNRGTSTGKRARARRRSPPVSRSAPRACWALTMRSSSSSSVGTKRSAMVIIIAISWAGKPRRWPGFSSHSRASARATGEVVRVTRDTPATNRMSRTARRPAVSSPSTAIWNGPQPAQGVPGVNSPWNTTVRATSHKTGRTLRTTNPRGSPETSAMART